MSEMATIPGYYTLKEAAEIIGVSKAQVSRYIAEGLLPHTDLGQQFLIEQQAVHNFERPLRGNPQFRKQGERHGS